MKTTIGCLGLIVLTSCVSATAEGKKVRITRNPQATAGCKFIGNVEAANGFGDVENRLQNEAAKIGADTVFMDQNALGPHSARGEAYLCAK